jgi:hypothetical protein
MDPAQAVVRLPGETLRSYARRVNEETTRRLGHLKAAASGAGAPVSESRKAHLEARKQRKADAKAKAARRKAGLDSDDDDDDGAAAAATGASAHGAGVGSKRPRSAMSSGGDSAVPGDPHRTVEGSDKGGTGALRAAAPAGLVSTLPGRPPTPASGRGGAPAAFPVDAIAFGERVEAPPDLRGKAPRLPKVRRAGGGGGEGGGRSHPCVLQQWCSDSAQQPSATVAPQRLRRSALP